MDELEAIALGKLKLSVNQYYRLTQRQFFNAFEGYNKEQRLLMQTSWEQTRIKAYYSALPNFKKVITIESFMPFEWDKKEDKTERTPKLTRKRLKELFKELD